MALGKLIGEAIKNWLPPTTGFSPYRSPGLGLSVPVLLLFLWVGWLLCGWNPYLWPFLSVYLVVGFALGPIIAIAAHYNPLITLIGMGLFIASIVKHKAIFTLHDTQVIFGLPLFPVSLTISGLLTVVTLGVFRQTFLSGSPLHRCIHAGDIRGFRNALEGDVDISQPDGDGRAPLHLLAINLGSVEEETRLQMAQELFTRKVDVNARDASGWTPLHHAAEWGQAEIAGILLLHNADPDPEDKDGITPLGLVGSNNSEGVAAVLLEHGANPNVRKSYGGSVMHSFGWAHQAPTLRLLLEKGGDPNLLDEEGRTPLFGIDAGVAIKILLEHGADPTVRDNKGQTPLHMASRKHDSGIYVEDDPPPTVQYLLDAGVEVEVFDDEGMTPLLESCAWGEPENGVALIKAGADINHRNQEGMTGMHILAAKGEHYRSQDLIDALVDNGFDINTANEQGDTPLHLAVKSYQGLSTYSKKDFLETMRHMIAKGADPTQQNLSGETPRSLAEKLKLKDLQTFLN
ncbi:ankyrin repeat domain-containing protein [Thermodesulfobacteriota bacterium]